MNPFLSACAAVLLWSLTSLPAHAFGDCAWAYYCPPVCCVTYQYQTVTSYRPEWQAEKVPCVINKVTYRPESYKITVNTLVPTWVDQTVRTSYYVPIPKVVERPVATCVMVPVTMIDPCSGCCFVSCCPQWVTTSVKCTVYDYQLNARDDVVKVCKWVTVPQVVDQVRYIPVVTQEQSWTVRYNCVMVPCQTTVCVPVYSWCYP